MDCSALRKGKVIRNYKEMCALLSEDIKTGNAKICQLKNWSRFFTYKNDGYKFCITKVYKSPLDKEDGRKGRAVPRRKGETLNLIEPLLIELLCKEENGGEIIMSRVEIYQSLGMLNSRFVENNVAFVEMKYSNGKKKYKVCNSSFEKSYHRIDGVDVRNEQLLYFYEIVNEVIVAILRSALTSLSKRGLIEYGKWCEIKYKDGKVSIADNEEMSKIRKIQQEILDSMGIEANQAYLLDNRREYFLKRNASARAVRNWEKIFNVLRVALMVTDDELAENPRARTLEMCRESSDELKSKLNGIIVSRVLETVRADYDKYAAGKRGEDSGIDNCADNDNCDNTDKVESVGRSLKSKVLNDKSFLETQRFLAEKLLKI